MRAATAHRTSARHAARAAARRAGSRAAGGSRFARRADAAAAQHCK
jgi:hypothetical protein